MAFVLYLRNVGMFYDILCYLHKVYNTSKYNFGDGKFWPATRIRIRVEVISLLVITLSVCLYKSQTLLHDEKCKGIVPEWKHT
jgi:hypothetical protein